MDECARYPVCPHRNVPAAYQRFHGPDSGGIERFFGDERMRVLDAVATLTSACERFERRAAMCGAAAYALLVLIWFTVVAALSREGRIAATLGQFYGVRLARALSQWAAHPQLPLLLGSRPILALRV
jgi:hypothetical protein